MFIDIHSHAVHFNDPRQRAVSRWVIPEELIAMWDDLGISRGVVLPLVHHETATVIQTSENVLDMYNRYPDRIIPFCNLDPRMHPNSAKTDFTPILTHYKELGCKGVGEMCANLPWDEDRVENLLHHIEAVQLPMIFHVASGDRGMYGLIDEMGLPKLEAALRKFPRLQLVGHSMGFWSAIDGAVTNEQWMGYPKGPVKPGGRLVELLRTCENLWADMSAGSGHNALARDPNFGYAFLEEFQDRVLFGTDICQPGQRVEQVEFLNAGLAQGRISRAAFEKITHKNAEKLLQL